MTCVKTFPLEILDYLYCSQHFRKVTQFVLFSSFYFMIAYSILKYSTGACTAFCYSSVWNSVPNSDV